MMRNMSIPDASTHSLTSSLLTHPYAGDTIYTAEQQEQSQASSAVNTCIETEDAVVRIGSILSNDKIVCNAERCGGRSFARLAELRRHYTTHHATNRPDLWCHVPTCRRSMLGGGEAFHRKDKLAAHIRNMHSSVQQE